MRMTIEQVGPSVEVDGVACQVAQCRTGDGVACVAFVVMVALVPEGGVRHLAELIARVATEWRTDQKVTLESTSTITDVEGTPCRIWRGELLDGSKVYAYVRRVAVRADAMPREFTRDLQERQAPASPAVHAAVSEILS